MSKNRKGLAVACLLASICGKVGAINTLQFERNYAIDCTSESSTKRTFELSDDFKTLKMRVKNYAKGTKEKDIENGYAKPTSEVVHEFNITFGSAKFKLMFASNFILSDEDRVDKISMKIIYYKCI